METMSPLDASFLHVEDAVTHMHIGSVGIFEGPAPGPGVVESAVAARLPLVPRYRQKVRFVPLALGRPVWVDDPHFSLDYHVRRTALPSPGGDEELRNLVGRVMSQQLDRAKPLWEMWVVEGLDDDHWGLISKTHHCMVDGVSGTDLLTVILSGEPDPGSAVFDDWQPKPEPNSVELVAHSVAGRAASPYEAVQSAVAAARGPGRVARQLAETTRGLVNLRSLLNPRRGSSLNGPIGPHRRWSWANASLEEVKEIRAALGGTVNDVVLCAITKGFRDLLRRRGERVAGKVVRALVPVSVRRESEKGLYNNRVSGLFPGLPVGIDSPLARLNAITEQMDGFKRSGQAVAGDVLTQLSGFAPPMLLAVSLRLALHAQQRLVQTVTTNVPGPQFPLYAAGRKMLYVYPYVPIAGSVRIGIAIFSYLGGLNFGVTGDYDSVHDIEVLTRGIESGIAERLEVARREHLLGSRRRKGAPSAAMGRSRRNLAAGHAPAAG
jgi:diacylglycerol O-acyltransferase